MVDRIVSGGQTGADRAGLDVAIELGIAHGGWCPKGRLAEDGEVPARYQLRETQTRSYLERTRRNVHDSDGTVILYRGRLAGGSRRTKQFADEAGKPCFAACLGDGAETAKLLRLFRAWLREHGIAVLNVAGNRESKSPGIHAATKQFLLQALAPEAYRPAEERAVADARTARDLPLAAEGPGATVRGAGDPGRGDTSE